MNTEFPRLLIISPSVFNPFTGGGITLSNLFRGWPIDRIAALHTDQNAPSTEICRTYYRLAADEIGWLPPIGSLLQRQKQAVASTPQAPILNGGENRLPRAVLSAISFEGLQDYLRITPKVSQWLEDFNPDLIYTILGSRVFIRLAAWAQKSSGAQLVVHIMDDWPETRYRRGLLAPIFHARLQTDLRKLIKHASGLFAISPKMAEAYSKRYERQFTHFSNALDPSACLSQARKDWQRRDTKLRLVYAGSIVENAQLSSLLELSAAAERISSSVDCEMVIYTSQEMQIRYAAVFAGFKRTRFAPPLTDENLIQSLAVADVLLLPVNFDSKSVEYVRYSNPTKLPAYLFSGTPILAYGPRGVDQIDRAHEDAWGLTVENRNRTELDAAILRLAFDDDLRNKLGKQGQTIAMRDHDIKKIRPDFQTSLIFLGRYKIANSGD